MEGAGLEEWRGAESQPHINTKYENIHKNYMLSSFIQLFRSARETHFD